MSAAEKDALALALAERLDVDYEHILARRILHLMNADEVRAIAGPSVDIQLHTHRHRVPADRDAFLLEISENREHIRRVTGDSARHFCYPSGEYAGEFLPWLRELGVRSAVTCVPGLASRRDDPLLLPRVLDNAGMSMGEFEGWTSGVSQLLKTG